MSYAAIKQLGSCLARDYAEDMFRLLVNYRDISASEAASRLGIHIRTAQDFLDALASLGLLEKTEASERKRPYFRYRLAKSRLTLDVDLEVLFSQASTGDALASMVRERKGSGAQFVTARNGEQIASVVLWSGRGRSRSERRISLTAAQGRFLYHLPFPTADALSVRHVMEKAHIAAEYQGEVLDLVELLDGQGVIERR